MKSRMADFGHRRRRPSPMGSGRLRSRTRRQTVASETPRIFAQSLTLRRRFSSLITVSLFSKRKRPGIPAKGSGPCLPTASVWTRWRIMLRPDAPPQASGHEKGPGGGIRAGPDFVLPRRAEGPRGAILEYQVGADMGGASFLRSTAIRAVRKPARHDTPLETGHARGSLSRGTLCHFGPTIQGPHGRHRFLFQVCQLCHPARPLSPGSARPKCKAPAALREPAAPSVRAFFRCADCADHAAPGVRGTRLRKHERPGVTRARW